DLLARRVLGSTRYPAPVAATWLATIERLGPLARAALTLAAFLAPDDIPRDLLQGARDLLAEGLQPPSAVPVAKIAWYRKPLAWIRTLLQPPPRPGAGVTPYELDRALGELKRYSMIRLGPDAFSVHRLLQTVQADGLADADRKEWARRAVLAVD